MPFVQTQPVPSIRAVQQLNFLSSAPKYKISGSLEAGDNFRVGDLIRYVPASQSWVRVLAGDAPTEANVLGVISLIKNLKGDVFNTADKDGNDLLTDWYFAEIFASFGAEAINCDSVFVDNAGTRIALDPAVHTGIINSPVVQWIPSKDINGVVENYIKLK